MQGDLQGRQRFVGACASAMYLGEALLLKVCDDALTQEIGRANDVQHLLMVVAKQSELEPIFCRIDRDGPRPSGTVEAVNSLALHTSEVHGVVQGADHAMIAGQTSSGFC